MDSKAGAIFGKKRSGRARVALVAGLIYLMLLAAPALAQEASPKEDASQQAQPSETTVPPEVTTETTEKNEDNTTQAEEATTLKATQANENTAQAEEEESTTGAQERASDEDEELVFAEGTQVAVIGRAAQRVGGPLIGTPVETLSTGDNDEFVEIIIIRRPDCRAEQGASFVLEDEDGTQATFIDNRPGIDNEAANVQILNRRVGLRVKSDDPNDNDIGPINETGGDDGELDTGGLRIATSTGITCEEDDGNDDGTGDEGDNDNGDNGNGGDSDDGGGNGDDDGEVASDNDDDIIINVPDDALPDTGGLPVSVLASLAALLLIVTSLTGVAAVRRRR